MSDAGRPLGIVIVGHVDHGKSTLIGRLLHETGSLPDGKVAELVASSTARGVEVEWSFVLDALQAERDQAITIDTTRVWFAHAGRRYVIIDAPGHREFVTNMMSGAAEADAAVLVVDAAEGLSEQTRRHAYLLRLLGVAQLIVAVNKMDLVRFEQGVFDRVAAETREHLATLGVVPQVVVPLAARDGDNLVARSTRMPWYDGPTIVDALAAFRPATVPEHLPLRLRVQDVYRRGTIRIAVGQIASGALRIGDAIVVSPTGGRARIKSLERWPAAGPPVAHAGESIGFILDKPIYVDRGDVISHETHAPERSSAFDASLFWLADEPPNDGEVFRVRFGPTESRVTVERIDRVVDSETFAPVTGGAVQRYSIVDVRLRSGAFLPLDARDADAAGARFVLLRGNDAVAGGVVVSVDQQARSADVVLEQHLVTRAERAHRNGHSGAVIWLTGLSGAGKSTIAMAVERRLFQRGIAVYVLDGDNVRRGLNRDLKFSAADRAENVRRVGEVAALFADSGTVAIAAFISPYRHDRANARAAAGDAFHEIYIRADVATCEARDTKGLYGRARRGEIADFTGISPGAPYEEPEHPELVIDTTVESLDESVDRLVAYIRAAVGMADVRVAGDRTEIVLR